MNRVPLHEIISEVQSIKGKNNKVQFLRQNYSESLRQLLVYGFDCGSIWLLPEGSPPFKPLEDRGCEINLYSEVRKLYLFVKGGNDNLTSSKREMLFVNFLEGIHPKDAEMIIALKDKKINLKHSVINAAFPGIVGTNEQDDEESE